MRSTWWAMGGVVWLASACAGGRGTEPDVGTEAATSMQATDDSTDEGGTQQDSDGGSSGGEETGDPEVDRCEDYEGVSCEDPAALPIDDPQTDDELGHNAAVEAALAELRALVAGYFSGESPTFQGSFAAGEFAADDVVAAIVWYDELPLDEGQGAFRLSAFSPSQELRLELTQFVAQPGRTYVTPVVTFNTSTGGPTAFCTDCAPDFATLPSSLAIDAVAEAGGMSFPASLDLQPLPVEDLTIEHVVLFNQLGSGDQLQSAMNVYACDGELLRSINTSLETVSADVPPGEPYDFCFELSSYHALGYVNLDCPEVYGLRDFSFSPPQVCCAYADSGDTDMYCL